MTTESSNKARSTNDLLRQRATAGRGRNDHPNDRVRAAGSTPQRRQVQMGEVLKPQQHA